MSDNVYKSVELTGSSTTSIEDAVERALEKASSTIENMQWFEVTSTRGHIVDNKVGHWQVSIKVGFTLE
ncbi:dodecin [Larsenimonas salina]|uniref:dodecin n=1 Tax=Larsenimonas salina TaxID=1295565 RepID=UPI002073C0D8|nr:dodecin [Larsenimonas salina]MCM5704342.1 dodecin family protein [Larsenimonas salina]